MPFQSPGDTSTGMSLIDRLGVSSPGRTNHASAKFNHSPSRSSSSHSHRPGLEGRARSGASIAISKAPVALLSRISPTAPLSLLDRIEKVGSENIAVGGSDISEAGQRHLVDRLMARELTQVVDMSASVVDEPQAVKATQPPSNTAVTERRAVPPVPQPVECDIVAVTTPVAIIDDPGSPISETVVHDLLNYEGSDGEESPEFVYENSIPPDNIIMSTSTSPERHHATNPNPEEPPPADRELTPPSQPLSLLQQCRNLLSPIVLQNTKLRDGYADMSPERVAHRVNAVLSDDRCADFMERGKEIAAQLRKLNAMGDQREGGADQQPGGRVAGAGVKRAREDDVDRDDARAKARKQANSDSAGSALRASQAALVDSSRLSPGTPNAMQCSDNTVDGQLHPNGRNKDGPSGKEDTGGVHSSGTNESIDQSTANGHDKCQDKISQVPRPGHTSGHRNESQNRLEPLPVSDQAQSSPNTQPPPPGAGAAHADRGQISDDSQAVQAPPAGSLQSGGGHPRTDPVPPSQSTSITQDVNTTHSHVAHDNTDSHMESPPALDPTSADRDRPPCIPRLPVPGLWFAKIGLGGADILEVLFDVDPESGAHWGLDNANTESTPRVSLHLLCLPTSLVSAAYATINRPPTPTDIANAMWSIRTAWPPRGKLAIEVNSGQNWGRCWLGRHLDPGDPPLDVTGCMRPGRNTIRFIQLGDLSECMFVLHVAEAESRARSPPSKQEMGSWQSWQSGKPAVVEEATLLDNYLKLVISNLKAAEKPGLLNFMNGMTVS